MDIPTTHIEQSNGQEVKNSETKIPINSGKKNRFENISSYIFLACVFLAPLVFAPSLYTPLDFVKTLVLSVLILLSAIAYSMSTLKNRTVAKPRLALAYASLGIVASVLLSSLLSSQFSKSFLGQGFEIGTASFIFLMFLSMFVVSRVVMKDKEMIFKIYTAVLASFIIAVLFHIIRLFGGADFLTLGFLSNLTSTMVGKWYDLALFAAVASLLSFLGMKFLPMGRNLKKILCIALIISGAVLVVVNFTPAWYALALILLCVGIYEYKAKTRTNPALKSVFSRISISTLILLIIAVACAWKGTTIAAPIAKSLQIEYGEVTLPWQLTLDVASNTLKESPLFGAGPNRFGSQYLRFKPFEVNQTPFWNFEFANGFGTLPTFIVTQGLVGLILWVLFLVFFVRDGIRVLRKVSDPLKTFFATSSFFIASFLWVINLIYTPSHAIIFLTFVFTGIFMSSVLDEGFGSQKLWDNKRLAPIVSSIILVILIVWLGALIKNSVAGSLFQSGIKELNMNKSISMAETDFKKALLWDTSDIYYQALSEVNILKVNTLIQELQAEAAKNPSVQADPKKIEQIGALTNEAVGYTRSAEKLDPLNHYNYLSEARISEVAASLKIPNAYENAKNSYAKALKVNPYNPGIYLNLARLEASQNKLTEAQQYVGKALQLKQNYTEAVYLLSQIQVSNNQLKDAIVSAQVATQITPTEPILFFQLGILQYNDKDYTNAVIALEKAITLNPQYANAKYFLGLSYVRLGKNEQAIKIFEDLATTNADNQEVAFILSNLKEGKSPFADVKPPIDNTPEKRKTLPVVEKTTEKATPKAVAPVKK